MGRDSTRAALNRYYAREARKSGPKRAPNEKPEFEFKKVAKAWLTANGFSIDVVESKAVYSKAAGRYMEGQTNAGFSDIVGVTPYYGVAAYIELKAPGRRSTLKPHQRDFLRSKITAGAFAVCIDTIPLLEAIYAEWVRLRKTLGYTESRIYLWNALPAIKELTDNLDDILKTTTVD